MKAIGIILAGGSSYRMKELAQKRAIGAMPIAGSFRAIDFALSNMTNSHIQKVAVFTQYNARSLNDHLNSSKWWDFGRKQGGLYIFTPAVTADNNFWYRGTSDAIFQNIEFLKRSHEPYVVICSSDCVYKMDYNKVLEHHIEKNADITVVCKELPAGTPVERYGTVHINRDSVITDFEEKPVVAKSNKISCGIYIIRRRLLIEMIEKCVEEDRYDFVRDILIRYKDQKKIVAYMHKGYWKNIASVEDYFAANMDFLDKEVRDYFFREYPDIYSKVDDLPPAKFNYGAHVNNGLISSGTIVNGTVENSVIFRKVYIGNNATIKNSIILNDVYIGDNAYIENCIVESHRTVPADTYRKGEGSIELVLENDDRYTM